MTQLITLASLNRPLTCAEFDSNNQALRERANHVGTQLASTISDLEPTVEGLPVIVELLLCCDSLTESIDNLRNDIFGSGDLAALLNDLEARVVNQINSLAAVVGTVQDQVTAITLDINSLIANIQALTSSTASLQGQITALTGIVNTKAPINNPTFTGTVTLPVPPALSNNNTAATTAFVRSILTPATNSQLGIVKTSSLSPDPTVYTTSDADYLLSLKAPVLNPVFVGSASMGAGGDPLPSSNDTRLATTSWVRARLNEIPGAVAEFPPGTTLVFHQDTAPPGWIKRTDIDNVALTVTAGNVAAGGVIPFTDLFTESRPTNGATISIGETPLLIEGTSLTIDQIPGHSHQLGLGRGGGDGGAQWASTDNNGSFRSWSTAGIQSIGGGQPHTHNIGAHTHTTSLHTHTIANNVKWLSTILAYKQ